VLFAVDSGGGGGIVVLPRTIDRITKQTNAPITRLLGLFTTPLLRRADGGNVVDYGISVFDRFLYRLTTVLFIENVRTGRVHPPPNRVDDVLMRR